MIKLHSINTRNSLKLIRFFAILTLFLNLSKSAFNQSVNLEKNKAVPSHKYFINHNPIKAMWMSAALPGLGQYYNQKYWKIPIVYSGFASLAYFSIINKQEYVKYRDAYAIKLALNGEESGDPIVDNFTSDQLLRQREYYQENLELNYILFGAFYLLQIIDATVDAHFYDFDIDDNLSIGIDPIIYQNRNQIHASPGLSLRWTIGNP
ncbi:MAG: DUF5683 domain-containing protein [Bacteroidales bacterium]|jgi:hypothetical protein|nr:DUF5683 domain-containing protein [Bacteroidales bacterium]